MSIHKAAGMPSTTDEVAQPITAADRIHAIDMLRGIALFGVLAVNLVGEFGDRVQFTVHPAGRPVR